MPKKIKKTKKTNASFYVHPSAVLEDNIEIGAGTKIWHFSQIRHDTRIGKNCVLANSVFVDFESEIGNNVKIQNHSIVYHKAVIEDGVFIGPNVCFTNDKIPRAINPDGSVKGADDWEVSTIRVGQGAAIGAHSVITPGVSVGRFAMAGSGSVITKDVPDFALVYGNPARVHGFVCRCGEKLSKFEKKDNQILGKCGCGISNEINKEAYQLWREHQPKKKIWIK